MGHMRLVDQISSYLSLPPLLIPWLNIALTTNGKGIFGVFVLLSGKLNGVDCGREDTVEMIKYYYSRLSVRQVPKLDSLTTLLGTFSIITIIPRDFRDEQNLRKSLFARLAYGMNCCFLPFCTDFKPPQLTAPSGYCPTLN